MDQLGEGDLNLDDSNITVPYDIGEVDEFVGEDGKLLGNGGELLDNDGVRSRSGRKLKPPPQFTYDVLGQPAVQQMYTQTPYNATPYVHQIYTQTPNYTTYYDSTNYNSNVLNPYTYYGPFASQGEGPVLPPYFYYQ